MGPGNEALPLLYEFPFSHFSEKARWVLDYCGQRYRSRPQFPGLHLLPMRLLSGQTSLPVLVCGPRPIPGSSRILRLVSRLSGEAELLGPPELRREARHWMDYLDQEIGVHMRRALLHRQLRDRAYMLRVFGMGRTGIERSLLGFGYPAFERAYRNFYDMNDSTARDSEQHFQKALTRLAAHIKSRRYLVGDRFGLADLTLGALLSPLTCVPEQPFPWPRCEDPYLTALYEHPVVQHARFLYRAHRHRTKAP